jgi:hypothetical protein
MMQVVKGFVVYVELRQIWPQCGLARCACWQKHISSLWQIQSQVQPIWPKQAERDFLEARQSHSRFIFFLKNITRSKIFNSTFICIFLLNLLPTKLLKCLLYWILPSCCSILFFFHNLGSPWSNFTKWSHNTMWHSHPTQNHALHFFGTQLMYLFVTISGRFLAELTKEVFSDLAASKYQVYSSVTPSYTHFPHYNHSHYM